VGNIPVTAPDGRDAIRPAPAPTGRTTVRGITVEADYVTVPNSNSVNPGAPGISLLGNHLTARTLTSISPRGDDGGGLRFWDTDINIPHNTIRDTHNLNGAHADCMRTFATDSGHPASQHILIDSNRCEQNENTRLIMEGPHSLAGDGSGIGIGIGIGIGGESRGRGFADR
jgi:hypothetical protein